MIARTATNRVLLGDMLESPHVTRRGMSLEEVRAELLAGAPSCSFGKERGRDTFMRYTPEFAAKLAALPTLELKFKLHIAQKYPSDDKLPPLAAPYEPEGIPGRDEIRAQRGPRGLAAICDASEKSKAAADAVRKRLLGRLWRSSPCAWCFAPKNDVAGSYCGYACWNKAFDAGNPGR